MRSKILFVTVFFSFCAIVYFPSFAQTNIFPTTGNVGIGTISPTESIEITGNIKASGAGNSYIQLGGGTSGNGGYIQGSKQAGSNAGYGTWVNHNAYWDGENWIQPRGTLSSSLYSSNYHLGFIWKYAPAGGTNGGIIAPNELMRLNPAGKLGLGTGSGISAKFHVLDEGEQLRLGYNASNYNVFKIGATGNLDIAAYGTNPNITLTPGGTGYTILNGNVGIGTPNPTEKLSVNGKVRAKEIKVEVANWPDYVFVKNYRVPSLDETEKFIQKNGHLEGIPSAEEVKKNGVDLGEMNAKLLKKIEELTLLLIQLNKKVEEQSKLIEKQ